LFRSAIDGVMFGGAVRPSVEVRPVGQTVSAPRHTVAPVDEIANSVRLPVRPAALAKSRSMRAASSAGIDERWQHVGCARVMLRRTCRIRAPRWGWPAGRWRSQWKVGSASTERASTPDASMVG
jgi:hypothetical protein